MGVLVEGEYDDGNGLARAQVAKHVHEKFSGYTSSINEQVLKISNQ